MQLTCPVCGQPFSPADVNLLGVFELYLLLTFVLSAAIRFHHFRSNMNFLLHVPQRWPRMYGLIREQTGMFLRWTMLVPVGITLIVFLMYLVAYRLAWTDAVVSLRELRSVPLSTVLLVLIGGSMLALDSSALFRSSQWDYNQIEQNLTRGESALQSRTFKVVRWLTRRRIDPDRIVRSRVIDSLAAVRLTLIDQLRRQSVHTAFRIAFGFLLWMTWYEIHHEPAAAKSVLASLSVLTVLAVVLIWLRVPLLDSPPENSRDAG
jgi:hypothetical protein